MLSPDLSPLRASRDFRLLFTSRTITLLGSQATAVALLLQAKDLTGSPLAVGLLGLAELAALIVFGLYGGVLADRLDRRRLLVGAELALAAAVSALLLNALLAHPQVWPLYVAAAAVMALAALQRPSLDATVPRTVPAGALTAASALEGLASNGAMILGGTLGGALAAEAGPASVYGLDVATFLLSALCLGHISAQATQAAAQPESRGRVLAELAEGARFVAGRQELIGSYLVDLAAMLLASATALLPFLAADLHARWSLGLMYAADSIGAVLAAGVGGWASRVRRYGRAIALSAGAWGVAMIGVGLSRSLVLVLSLLVLAGAADMYSGIFRQSLWNLTVPDALRGRVAGIELLSYGIGPSGGQLRAGAVASLAGIRLALWSGGVACVAVIGGLCGVLPRFVAFTAGAPRE